MGSQFVDFNGDGHIDYLTATFDGSPHIAYGSEAGFGKPETLKDARGERILITSYWDYGKSKHLVTSRAISTDQQVDERCISALAFDWDADGDYDLLLGSYENGHLYRQMNEGNNAAPKFTGKNIPVLAGGKHFALPAKMTAPILVDWDGDGDLDLIAGSFGQSYGQSGKGGGLYLSRNIGSKGKPSFSKLEILIPPSPKGHVAPTRPDAGLYADAVDYDGDGDLDLIVGGYSMWTPKARLLTAAQKARAASLGREKKQIEQERFKLMNKISTEMTEARAGLDQSSAQARTKMQAVFSKYRTKTSTLDKKLKSITKRLHALVPGPKREAFVWLYERL